MPEKEYEKKQETIWYTLMEKRDDGYWESEYKDITLEEAKSRLNTLRAIGFKSKYTAIVRVEQNIKRTIIHEEY